MLTNFTKGNNSIAQAVIASQFSFGVIALTYFLLTEQFDMIGYAVVFHYFMFMFCHNVSLHRYFAHRSFETSKFWHIIMCVVSPIACGGSPYSYAVAHRTHHAYSDTENDPHSPANSSLLDVAFVELAKQLTLIFYLTHTMEEGFYIKNPSSICCTYF